MALYFKDRIPEPIHGENARYYDAVGNNNQVKLQDFKLVMKNGLRPDRTGDPVNAANLNFASGNVSFPEAVYFSPELKINRGDLVSLSPDGAVKAFMPQREIALTGPTHQSRRLEGGCIRLSDTKYLLIYNSSACVATVNWGNKTVSLGTVLETSLSGISDLTFSLVCDFDTNPQRAVVSYLYRDNTYLRVYARGLIINPATNTITQMSAHTFDSTQSNMSLNTVALDDSRVIVCCKNSSSNNPTVYFSLMDYSGEIITLKHTLQLGPYGGNLDDIGLFCYDRNRRACVWLHRTGDDIFAVNININGDTITAGTRRQIGTTGDMSVSVSGQTALRIAAPMVTDRFWGGMGKIALISQIPGENQARIQILSVNSSGEITKGGITRLPLFMNINHTFGSVGITYKSNSRIYITGIDADRIPREPCFIECAIDGVNISSVKRYRPFRSMRMQDDQSISYFLKTGAIENPGKPGEFLFLLQYNGGNNHEINSLIFTFGHKNDNFAPDNIIGVALGEPESGRVTVQTTAKYLPGLFQGLTSGVIYRAGTNGKLAPLTGAANAKALGIAFGDSDFYFFGAANL
ncbi:MAG: hypothetical protein FWH10_01120 [Oscillospiraceae bacterium]|nr:hypothetical protein [Oscillospiraceae bacterium]